LSYARTRYDPEGTVSEYFPFVSDVADACRVPSGEYAAATIEVRGVPDCASVIFPAIVAALIAAAMRKDAADNAATLVVAPGGVLIAGTGVDPV